MTIVPWIDTAAPKQPPTPSELSVRRCAASDLAGAYLRADAAAGNDINFLTIRNMGRTDCYVQGRPRVRLFTTDGRASRWSSGETYFPDEGPIEILLRPGTTLPAVNTEVRSGQAKLGFTYFDCDLRDRIRRVEIATANGTMIVVVPSDRVGPTGLPACNASTASSWPAVDVEVNNFEPPPFPPSPFGDLLVTITPPRQIVAGSRLRYVITIDNHASTPFNFGAECPGYQETIESAGRSATFSYRLNCAAIPDTSTVQFEMLINVPAAFAGKATLTWWFLPYRDDAPGDRLPIVIRT